MAEEKLKILYLMQMLLEDVREAYKQYLQGIVENL